MNQYNNFLLFPWIINVCDKNKFMKIRNVIYVMGDKPL